MADLRQATDTVGVPEALAAGDVNGLVRLMTPIAANIRPTVASIQLRVLDRRDKQVLRVEGTRVGVSAVDVTEPNAFTAEPAVIKVLAGETDTSADADTGAHRDARTDTRAHPDADADAPATAAAASCTGSDPSVGASGHPELGC